MDIYKEAAEKKIRYDSPNGSLTVEDLFDLPLQTKKENKPCLDSIAKDVYKALENTEISFVNETSRKDQLTHLKMDVVKDVIETKKQREKESIMAAKAAEKKDRILSIMYEKEEEDLKGKSYDELKELLNSL